MLFLRKFFPFTLSHLVLFQILQYCWLLLYIPLCVQWDNMKVFKLTQVPQDDIQSNCKVTLSGSSKKATSSKIGGSPLTSPTTMLPMNASITYIRHKRTLRTLSQNFKKASTLLHTNWGQPMLQINLSSFNTL